MNRRSLFAAVFVAHLTAACGTSPSPEIPVQVVEVAAPTAVSCVPDNLPPKPTYRMTSDLLREAPDAAARYLLAVVGMLERDARLNEVEPVVEGCRRVQ